MRRKKLRVIIWLAVLAIAGAAFVAVEPGLWDFARPVGEQERQQRLQVVEAAVSRLGCREADGTHRPIIDLYNSHTPLARGYAMQYDDEWCAAFVSAVAIDCGITDILPTECGCERQIGRFMELDAWVEEDGYIPLPADVIFYHWKCRSLGDCTDWSDHVGIVVGTWMNWIKVVEGNKGDEVAYRWLPVNDLRIRGYGVPNYG